ncbi:MAG TPA: 2-oxoglutarate dehydrogenase complex dihydrolipoyllysine-residue succinyltransferase [Bacteroidia bacterium]|nr:2-oxoglutarate dehydrogenase complex dihydrolipoyllysine-residue succinyltransferase [Bacteroidia bacterium]HNT79362.1 2-oxoglutarate dehydrogenase complex dihydrolipoyllysine-residue succinyltransferase [Bacteroidia bacterium]
MKVKMSVPSPGESITEVQIARWLKKDGDIVEKDEELAEIDSDKATLTLNATEAGQLNLLVAEGETVKVGATVCTIDTSIKPSQKNESENKGKNEPAKVENKETKAEVVSEQSKSAVSKVITQNESGHSSGIITKQHIVNQLKNGVKAESSSARSYAPLSREVKREKMSMLRKKISERLVSVKNETAMLTTFNEVDMGPIMKIRNQYKEKFKEKHGVGLGFMSFFTKAVTEALLNYPAVNAMIDGEEVVYHNYCDIGIAVSAPKGLMVPVIRNAESMSLHEIESAISDVAVRARENKISLDEMSGGTFTISNGGVFGSLMSTPIINPPQSAILGMHNIVERPMAVNGNVEIKPMMYVALSYDHRIIDGRESVGFLVMIKNMLENPVQLMFSGKDPIKRLLEL